MLLHNSLADGSADDCGHDHTGHQRHGYPGLQHLGRGKDGVLTAIGDHLICHRFRGNCIGNDGAAEGGQHLIDDIADGQRLCVAVAHLPQQQLGNDAGENKEDDVRQISAHNGADNAVNEDRTGLFHLRADDEVDNALQQGEKYRHQNDGNGRCVQDGAGKENDHIDKGQQDNGDDVLDFQLVGDCSTHGERLLFEWNMVERRRDGDHRIRPAAINAASRAQNTTSHAENRSDR